MKATCNYCWTDLLTTENLWYWYCVGTFWAIPTSETYLCTSVSVTTITTLCIISSLAFYVTVYSEPWSITKLLSCSYITVIFMTGFTCTVWTYITIDTQLFPGVFVTFIISTGKASNQARWGIIVFVTMDVVAQCYI